MNAPIDMATTRTGPPTDRSISAAVSATICAVEKPSAFSVSPIPRLSKVIHR